MGFAVIAMRFYFIFFVVAMGIPIVTMGFLAVTIGLPYVMMGFLVVTIGLIVVSMSFIIGGSCAMDRYNLLFGVCLHIFFSYRGRRKSNIHLFAIILRIMSNIHPLAIITRIIPCGTEGGICSLMVIGVCFFFCDDRL